jgi:hypothetical protein
MPQPATKPDQIKQLRSAKNLKGCIRCIEARQGEHLTALIQWPLPRKHGKQTWKLEERPYWPICVLVPVGRHVTYRFL